MWAQCLRHRNTTRVNHIQGQVFHSFLSSFPSLHERAQYGGSNVLSTYPNHASLSSHGEETTSALWDYFKKVCILPPFPLCRHWSDVVGLVKTKGKLNFSYPATYKISGYLDEGGGKNMHWTSIGAGPMERGPCKAVDTLALGLDSPKPPPLQYCVPVPSLLSGHPFWPRVPPDPAVRVC